MTQCHSIQCKRKFHAKYHIISVFSKNFSQFRQKGVKRRGAADVVYPILLLLEYPIFLPFQSHCSFIRVSSVDMVADEDGDDHHDDDDVNIAAQLWSLQTGSGPPWAPRSSLLKENSKLNVWLNHLNRKAFLSNIFWVPSDPGACSPYFISSSTIWLKPPKVPAIHMATRKNKNKKSNKLQKLFIKQRTKHNKPNSQVNKS